MSCEGKVFCNFLEPGQFGSPNSKGVCLGALRGEHSLKVARSAGAVRAQCKDSPYGCYNEGTIREGGPICGVGVNEGWADGHTPLCPPPKNRVQASSSGEHVQLFRMVYDRKKGFQAEHL